MIDFSKTYNNLIREVVRTGDVFNTAYADELLSEIENNKTEDVDEIRSILGVLEVLIMFSNTSTYKDGGKLVGLYKGFLIRYYVKKNPEVVLDFVMEAI